MSACSCIGWHGSPHSFAMFDFSRLEDGLGVFFAAERRYSKHPDKAEAYQLRFQNLLHVRQGQEYRNWLLPRAGEKNARDVRRRLLACGYDGVRIEYAGGAVDYVAFGKECINPAGVICR